MKDYKVALERLRKDAAEAALIRDLAKDETKQDCHSTRLADEVEQAMSMPKTV